MFDEPLIALEVRAADAKRLAEMLVKTVRAAELILSEKPDYRPYPDWPEYIAASKRLIAAIDRTQGQLGVLSQLQQAGETALAYLTNGNTFEFEEVITALCGALRAAGSDADLLDDVEASAAQQSFAAPCRACRGNKEGGPVREGAARDEVVAEQNGPGPGGPPGA